MRGEGDLRRDGLHTARSDRLAVSLPTPSGSPFPFSAANNTATTPTVPS